MDMLITGATEGSEDVNVKTKQQTIRRELKRRLAVIEGASPEEKKHLQNEVKKENYAQYVTHCT